MRVAEPYFANHQYKFVASTVFGMQIAGDTQDFLHRCIYYFGVWEPNLTRWIGQRLEPGDTFVDVGANIGYYSLLASTLVGVSGGVVAIEPSPTIFAALQHNLVRNRVTNVRAVNVAASDREGVVKLFRGPYHNLGETTTLEEQNLEVECEVDAIPLDAILVPQEIHNARLVKIDVEGAECSVVAGMSMLLSSCRPDLEIIVEVHPEQLVRQGRRPEDLMRIFLDAGFYAYGLENDDSPLGYLLPRTQRRLMPIRSPVQHESITIFSRQDSERL